VLERVMAVHGADKGDAQVYDEQSGKLEMVAWCGIADDAAARWKWVDPRCDTTVCCRAFRNGQALYISDVMNDPPYAPYLAETLASGIRAVHSIPVLVDGRCVAVVSPMYSVPRVLPMDALAQSLEIIRNARGWPPVPSGLTPPTARPVPGVLLTSPR
jgi:GAF domain-containing protein